MIGITGATGFIGSHLILRLKSKGIPYKIITRRTSSLSQVDTVIHLAGRSSPPEDQMITDNVQSTQKIISIAKRAKVKKMIYLSTVVVYGESKIILTEKSKPKPQTQYGKTKFRAENKIIEWAKLSGGVAIILRPFNIYGPGSFKGVINNFWTSIQARGCVSVNGDGSQKRDFLFVDDLIDALIKSIAYPKSGIFNIVTEKEYSLLELLKKIEGILNKKIPIKFEEYDATKPKNIRVSARLAKIKLGWESKTSLNKGLKITFSSYAKNITN